MPLLLASYPSLANSALASLAALLLGASGHAFFRCNSASGLRFSLLSVIPRWYWI